MSTGRSTANTLPTYAKPPVIEVACGVRFERIKEFKAPHTGLLWEKFRGDFPQCQHASPIGPDLAFDNVGLPMPRIWFLNKEGNNLIQVQSDRFHFNWRKMREDEKYPRYEQVMSSFKRRFEVFSEFLDEVGLGPVKPVECELIYINHIPKGEGWNSTEDTHQIFRDFRWSASGDRFLPAPLHVGWETHFPLPEDKGRLIVNLKQGSRKIDKLPILVFELVARGLGQDKSFEAVWDWFEVAHRWIVFGFADLITLEMQRTAWQREDETKGKRKNDTD